MLYPRVQKATKLFALAMLVLLTLPSLAHADFLTSYTLTNLGPGVTQPSSSQSGHESVFSPTNGKSYAFDYTDHQVLDPNELAAAQRALPSGAGQVTELFVNRAGDYVALATQLLGPDLEHGNPRNTRDDDVYAGRITSDGTFGSASMVWGSGWTIRDRSLGSPAAHIYGISDSGLILVSRWDYDPDNFPKYSLLDLHSPDPFNRYSSYVQSKDLWYVLRDVTNPDLGSQFFLTGAPPILDDRGRVLFKGMQFGGDWREHTLLLTPPGLSTDPITVPEPSSLIIMAIGAGTLACCRRRQLIVSRRSAMQADSHVAPG